MSHTAQTFFAAAIVCGIFAVIFATGSIPALEGGAEALGFLGGGFAIAAGLSKK